MAETTVASPEPEPGREPQRDAEPELSSDRHPDNDGWLGDFRRGPAVFALFRIGPNNGGHPLIPPEYRIECNDGAGPRVICRFSHEPEPVPEWFGAWQGDEWSEWILAQAHVLIADSDYT